jgi:tetratricopeptide (TPR) repeat protein
MTASVGIINELIGTRFGVVSSVLEAGVGNYYTVVLFHIMGYMIFQYQDKLGFTARADHGDRKVAMDDAEKTKRLVDILIKEGQFDLALEELKSGANKFPADPHFARQCFEFILASRNTGSIDEIGSYYLGYLVRRKEFDQLNHAYKRILALSKDFQADTAEVRHQVAQVLQQLGDAKSAAKVLNHLHREFPDYAQLPAAYQLMARCLEELPDMQKQARKYTEFAAKLDKQQKEKLAKPAETHAEEPGDAAPVQQAQQNGSLHGVVDQELVDSLTLVPTEEERQAEENRQKEAESGTFGQDPVDGMSLIPIDK